MISTKYIFDDFMFF